MTPVPASAAVRIVLAESDPRDVEQVLGVLGACLLGNAVEVVPEPAGLYSRLAAGLPEDTRSRILLLDVRMLAAQPTLLAGLRTNSRTRDASIVLLASDPQDPVLAEGLKSGVRWHLLKPVDARRFTEVLRAVGFHWLLVQDLPPPA